MSEPQHPFGTDGTETNAGRSAPEGVPSPLQAVPETLGAVGARLAQLREAKGWSVEDVSARLKVAVTKLRELEAGDISHLPDATFAVGVVRAYAKLLGADPAPFTQALRRERGASQQDLSMPASAGADLPRGRVSLSLGGGGGGVRAPRRRASWLWGVALVVVAVIVIGMWHTNSGESSAWFARIKSMANGVGSSTASHDSGASSATVTEGETAGASAAQGTDQTDVQAGEVTNEQAGADQGAASAPQAAQVAPAAPASAAPAANTAVAPVVPKAASAVQAQAPTPTPAASAPAAAAQGASAPAAGDTSTFAIRVTQDTWVSVRQKDGKEVFSGLVHGSDAREITGVGPLKVTVGNKAGIESMSIDGQPVDASKYASARGNVARFVLP
ncbi:helix-turn-helix domain-containing protein [Paraburkholderia sp. J67]|uniref:helix-turn-helix domain-containing protein n=1 Tax=Paraburkholderia sp. J67 TaxID=2805435 RepID=UPI002ABE021C|nr:RodZ domain-containing protein [Paraburkholderia sp. J67]